MKRMARIFAVVTALYLGCAVPSAWAESQPDVPTTQQVQLQIEQNRKAVLSSIATPITTQVFYFGDQARLSDKPQKGGYFRKVLGKTTNGKWVVEDFYQDSQTKRTNPKILSDKDLRNFVASKSNGIGLVVVYYPDGTVMGIQPYQDGKEYGWGQYYDANGVLRLCMGTERVQYFDRQGRKRADMGKDVGNDEYYWYANGQLAAFVPKNSEAKTWDEVKAWDKDGTEVTDPDEIAAILSTQMSVVSIGLLLVLDQMPGPDMESLLKAVQEK